MATLQAVPVDPPGLPPRPITGRLRLQLNYFTVASPDASPDHSEYTFDPIEVDKWLDDGVFYLVSPLDTANQTEVELSEEQEEFLHWLKRQGVRRVRVVES